MSQSESLIQMEDPRYPNVELQDFTNNDTEHCELNGMHDQLTNSSVGTQLSKRNSSERSLPLRSYSKWSPTEQGATIVWRDLCVYTAGEAGTTPSLHNMKRIINNSTGAVQPGNLMALMGSRFVSSLFFKTYLTQCWHNALTFN